MKLIIGVLLLVFSHLLQASSNLSCYEEPGTRKTSCIDEHAVTANGSVRASPLYLGGPNRIKKSSVTIVTNCDKGVTTLQDRDGVNFSGGESASTDVSRSLSQWICEVKKPKTDRALKQF